MKKNNEAVYRWRSGAYHKKGDPLAIGRELDRLAKSLGTSYDMLSSEAILDAAKEAKSPLHGMFNWNDKQAAHSWRLEEARQLVRAIEISYTGGEKNHRMVNVISKEGERGYVSTETVSKNTFFTAQVLEAALAGIVSWLNRYKEIGELSEAIAIFQEGIIKIEEAIQRIKTKKTG